MKITPTSYDYDALLTEAQIQWRIKENVLSRLAEAKYSSMLHGGQACDHTDKILALEEKRVIKEYNEWIDKTFTQRGIICIFDPYPTHKPIKLQITVAE